MRDKQTGKLFVTEMKCEIEYQNYKYLTLADVDQLAHHKKPAFQSLLGLARNDPDLQTFIGSEEVPVDGAILIWGALTAAGRDIVMATKGFHDVLSIQAIIEDLRSWNCERFHLLMEQRRLWTNEMFESFVKRPPVTQKPT